MNPASDASSSNLIRPPGLSRRRFFAKLGAAGAGALALATLDSKIIEPQWLKVRRVRLATGQPISRFAYFTDLHYKGDRTFAEAVVDTINRQKPDFVCFGGDLIEEARFMPEALAILSQIKAPLFGVPGNHDYWSHAPLGAYQEAFRLTGGEFLLDDHRLLAGGRINLMGLSCVRWAKTVLPIVPDTKNILLMHYPAWVKRLGGQRCDLTLAGHSHGGQVRLPLVGALFLPAFVDEYELGLYQTAAGPLYVNPGIGWFHANVRFNCRPEVTVFEV